MGDPNDLARLIVAGIEHKGFSFIQALSVCPTYRPEHAEWKNQVKKFGTEATADPMIAIQRIVADDGMNTGIIYQRNLPNLLTGALQPSARAGDSGSCNRPRIAGDCTVGFRLGKHGRPGDRRYHRCELSDEQCAGAPACHGQRAPRLRFLRPDQPCKPGA